MTAHDGFTLHDLTAHDHKHNATNGEENRDGTDDNRSWNHGVEGPTEDADVLAARRRSARSLLATLLLSAGVPMLAAGDETGRTQGGNNNAYCQDTEVSWLDWSWAKALHGKGDGGVAPPQHALDLLETTRFLLSQRVRHPALSPRTFPTPDGAGGTPRFRWFDESGEPMRNVDWHDGARGVLVLVADDAAAPAAAPVVLVLNGMPHEVEVTLPDVLAGRGRPTLLWCSDQERPGEPMPLDGTVLRVGASTFSLLSTSR